MTIKITKTVSISDNQRAVVESYGFDLKNEGMKFILTDETLRNEVPKNSKVGKYTGDKLDEVLQRAIETRKGIETASQAASALLGTQSFVSDSEPAADAADDAEVDFGPGPGSVVNADEGDDEPALPLEEEAPPAEISGDIELDNSGTRVSKPKRGKAVRKDSRYLRAAKALIADPIIDAVALSKAAGLSEGTAGYCLEAWNSFTKAMIDAGWLDAKRVAKPKIDA